MLIIILIILIEKLLRLITFKRNNILVEKHIII